MDQTPEHCWRQLALLACTGADRLDQLIPPWETQAIHRHSVPTVTLSLAGTTSLEVGPHELLPLPVGHMVYIEPWTWHAHPRPHGNGISLVVGQAGPIADVWLLIGPAGSWWGEMPLAPLAAALAELAQATTPAGRQRAGQALIGALAAGSPQPAPGGGPLRRLCAFAWLHRTQPITAAQLLASSGLAYANAHRLFVRRFGTTPKRYLLDCRLSLARRLLAGGATPGAIWQECGFRSRADMSRRMRLDTGRPPRAWRGG